MTDQVEPPIAGPSLAENVLQRLGELVDAAERDVKPLEVDPYRGQLFELFVTAEAAGYLAGDAEIDLTADGVCRELASRWNLADAARQSFAQQQKLPSGSLTRMRMLWSLMRMWMEWEYAWSRWHEFHTDRSG